MSRRDRYYNRAKQEGYRSRAAYKLRQLDEATALFSSGDVVVDLGAAPGGWLQIAAERVGPEGRVLGVDRQEIEPLDGVETLVGDLTEPETRARIHERVGNADVVLSDMAPNMSGEYELDHARSVHLARQALAVAMDLLASGGDFAAKVFQGPDVDSLQSDLEAEFDHVRIVEPDASRSASSEVYLVAKGRLRTPVRPGDRLDVSIEAIGEEGDGIAKVDGFTLFVPDTDIEESVTVEVTDVKPRFGFARRVD